ncbi:MAG: DMT family transporter [Rhizobiaceae bacterium]
MTKTDAHNQPRHPLATGREKLLGHLAMLLFAALIAGSFSIGHKAAPYIGAAALNAVRFALGTGLMAALLYIVNRPAIRPPESLWRFIVLGGLMASYFVLMFVALRISNPVSTGAMFTLIPLMSAGFGWFFLRQVTRPVVFLSLLVAAAGAVWVIFRADISAILAFDIGRGESIFFAGCVAHAAYAPLVRKFNRGEPVMQFTVYTLAATTVWILLVAGPQLVTTDFASLPPIVWLAIAYLAIFTTAGTFFLLQFASLRLPASKVLAYGYLTPSFIILIEGTVGHGWAGLPVIAGALLTACALLVMAFAPDA